MKMEKTKEGAEQRKREAEAKVQSLRKKMATAQGKAKDAIEARVHDIRKDSGPEAKAPQV